MSLNPSPNYSLEKKSKSKSSSYYTKTDREAILKLIPEEVLRSVDETIRLTESGQMKSYTLDDKFIEKFISELREELIK